MQNPKKIENCAFSCFSVRRGDGVSGGQLCLFVICAELRVTAQRERQSSDLAYAWGALRKLAEPVGCPARLLRLKDHDRVDC